MGTAMIRRETRDKVRTFVSRRQVERRSTPLNARLDRLVNLRQPFPIKTQVGRRRTPLNARLDHLDNLVNLSYYDHFVFINNYYYYYSYTNCIYRERMTRLSRLTRCPLSPRRLNPTRDIKPRAIQRPKRTHTTLLYKP